MSVAHVCSNPTKHTCTVCQQLMWITEQLHKVKLPCCVLLAVENCQGKSSTCTDWKPLMFMLMWDMEHCYGNAGRLISRTGAVFLICHKGVVFAGTSALRPELISQAMKRLLRWHLTSSCPRCPLHVAKSCGFESSKENGSDPLRS